MVYQKYVINRLESRFRLSNRCKNLIGSASNRAGAFFMRRQNRSSETQRADNFFIAKV